MLMLVTVLEVIHSISSIFGSSLTSSIIRSKRSSVSSIIGSK